MCNGIHSLRSRRLSGGEQAGADDIWNTTMRGIDRGPKQPGRNLVSRPDTLYIFLSVEDRSLCGLSTDMMGENFPGRYGSWEYLGIAIPIEHALSTMAAEIVDLIERYGHAIVRNATVGGIWPLAEH
jgi:hypothetical protein